MIATNAGEYTSLLQLDCAPTRQLALGLVGALRSSAPCAPEQAPPAAAAGTSSSSRGSLEEDTGADIAPEAAQHEGHQGHSMTQPLWRRLREGRLRSTGEPALGVTGALSAIVAAQREALWACLHSQRP